MTTPEKRAAELYPFGRTPQSLGDDHYVFRERAAFEAGWNAEQAIAKVETDLYKEFYNTFAETLDKYFFQLPAAKTREEKLRLIEESMAAIKNSMYANQRISEYLKTSNNEKV